MEGRALRKATVLGLLATVLVPSLVVANATHQEYRHWEDRPLGILDLWYNLQTHSLPPTPQWKCGYHHQVVQVDGAFLVRIVWIGDYYDADLAQRDWAGDLGQRFPLAFSAGTYDRVPTLDELHRYARKHPDELVLGLSGTYHRGGHLNQRVEGFACDNLAVVTAHTECVGAILAHEVGHALGLDHDPAGLMRPRGVPCEDRLAPHQVQYLIDRYAPAKVEDSLPATAEEPGPSAGSGGPTGPG